MPSLTFLGAARTVTGSKYLLDIGPHRLLIDCGLFQGLKDLRQRNWQPLPADPRTIHAVVLTHAHLDHSGWLPRLVSAGFRGRVFCTPGTLDLCQLVLPDSARIQEEDARYANRHGYSKHSPALPLYTHADAARALSQFKPVGYGQPVDVLSGVNVEFINAGHLLGSAYARITLEGGRQILFGGDLGRYSRPVLPDPAPVEGADWLLVESTYGDRVHPVEDSGARLAAIVTSTVARGGKLIIPAFTIGRVEEVLYWLHTLEDRQAIPVLPVYVDSPMAVAALQYYVNRRGELDQELRSAQRELCDFYTKRFTAVGTPAESKAVTASSGPSIVISASGMATGGRVLHHLATVLPDSRNTVLFVGYQAAGTRGRSLVDGAGEVKLLGRMVKVAARVERLDSMSAHADSSEILRWLSGFTRPPRTTFIVHGEPVAQDALRATIVSKLGWSVCVPQHLEKVELV